MVTGAARPPARAPGLTKAKSLRVRCKQAQVGLLQEVGLLASASGSVCCSEEKAALRHRQPSLLVAGILPCSAAGLNGVGTALPHAEGLF